MGYTRYVLKESLGHAKDMEIVRELKKKDIDAEYGITENGNVAMSPINNSEIEEMNIICKKYGVTPVFVKKVNS